MYFLDPPLLPLHPVHVDRLPLLPPSHLHMEVLGGLELPRQYLPEVTLIRRVGEVPIDHLAKDLCLGPDDLEHVVLNRVLRMRLMH